MCREHTHGEEGGVAAADHRVLVGRPTARRRCRHVLATCARAGPLVPIGAWCAGMCWEVCGLMCGTLSGRAGGATALAARRSRAPPSSQQCSGSGAPPSSPVAGATRSLAAQECAVSWRAVCDFGTATLRSQRGFKKGTFSKKDFTSHQLPPTSTVFEKWVQ